MPELLQLVYFLVFRRYFYFKKLNRNIFFLPYWQIFTWNPIFYSFNNSKWEIFLDLSGEFSSYGV